MIPGNDNNGGQERRTLWIVLLLNAAIAAGFFVSGFFADATMSAARSSALVSGCTAPGENIADDGLYSSSSSSKFFCWMSIGHDSMIGRLSSFAR